MEREVEIQDGIYERIETVGFAGLTEAERFYFAIWWLEGEAGNGGFQQLFRNSSGELAHEALEGLKAVGAMEMAAIFQKAVNLFPGGQVPKDGEERRRLLNALTAEQREELAGLSHEFTGYPDDLEELVEEYVEEHEDEFRGPRTLLEQWEARRARGAETRPEGMTDEKLEADAAKERPLTDRSCPVCGHPAPEHRKSCKRCGYPFGRGRVAREA